MCLANVHLRAASRSGRDWEALNLVDYHPRIAVLHRR
jgi:hypothetical protein